MTENFLVQAHLPYAGLGNMLLVWARAYVFAHLNSFPMEYPNWSDVHIGPWIRRERTKRYYGSYFQSKNYQSKITSLAQNIFQGSLVHENPLVQRIDLSLYSSQHRHVFSFDKMPPWDDYFEEIKDYHIEVKKRLLDDTNPSLLSKLMKKSSPGIAIHIRRGDYQKPKADDDFTVRRYVYTPIDWYVETLTAVRKIIGADVPATIFSDGYSSEIQAVLQLSNVSLSNETCALSDMITMSRSKLLIASAHSSFSAWASYLAQCPTLWPSERASLYKPIFTGEVANSTYEGGFDSSISIPHLLESNLLSIHF
jgi:hypothetical protein